MPSDGQHFFLSLDQFQRGAVVCTGGGLLPTAYHHGFFQALREHGFSIPSLRDTDQNMQTREDKQPQRGIDCFVGSSGGAVAVVNEIAGFTASEIVAMGTTRSRLSYYFPQRHEQGSLCSINYWDIFRPNVPRIRDITRAVGSLFNGHSFHERYAGLGGLEARLRELPLGGFFTTDGIEAYYRNVLPTNNFFDLPAQVYLIATDCDAPRRVAFGKKSSPEVVIDEQGRVTLPSNQPCRDLYLNNATISEALSASCAIPLLFKPRMIDGHSYTDGEVKNTLSLQVPIENGADLIIVSHTFTPEALGRDSGTAPRTSSLVDLLFHTFNTILYQKIQTARAARQQQQTVYAWLGSDTFRERYGLTAQHQEDMLAEYERLSGIMQRYTIIYCPAPPFIQGGDHLSLSPELFRRVMYIGYRTATEVLRHYGCSLPLSTKTSDEQGSPERPFHTKKFAPLRQQYDGPIHAWIGQFFNGSREYVHFPCRTTSLATASPPRQGQARVGGVSP
ncbi:patatin-like phospholipase family protein [Candidatus Woesearchaeota archaeon]|nr:patatin-like phospholipase family protein [Candidatus Woesearchaeota archaeon]